MRISPQRGNKASYHFPRGQLARALAYLVLALGTAFAIYKSETDTAALTHRTANALAVTTYNVLVRSCNDANKLRDQIRERSAIVSEVVKNTDKLFIIVAYSAPPTDPIRAELLNAAEQNARIIKRASSSPDRNCVAAYAPLKPKS